MDVFLNYSKGFLYLLVFIIQNQLIGQALCSRESSIFLKQIAGWIAFMAGVTIVYGVSLFLQAAYLDVWMYLAIWSGIALVAALIWMIWKRKWTFFHPGEGWGLGCALLVLLLLAVVLWFSSMNAWNTFSYDGISYGTLAQYQNDQGILSWPAGIRAWISTLALEPTGLIYGFYNRFLHIPESLYAGFFIPLSHLWLALCSSSALLALFVHDRESQKFTPSIGLAGIGLLVLFIEPALASQYHLWLLPEPFDSMTSVAYGLGIIRLCGLFLFMLPYLSLDQSWWKLLLAMLGVGLALFNSGLAALAMLVVAALSLCGVILYRTEYRLIGLIVWLTITAIVMFGLWMFMDIDYNSFILYNWQDIAHNWVWVAGMAALVLMMFMPNTKLRLWNGWLLLICLFTLVPYANTLVLFLCRQAAVYGHLCAAVFTAIVVSFMVELLYVIMVALHRPKIIVPLFIVLGLGLEAGVLYSMNQTRLAINGQSILSDLSTRFFANLDNPNLMPESTLNLSVQLARQSASEDKEDEETAIVVPEQVMVRAVPHQLAAALQSMNPDLDIVSANSAGWSADDQKLFEHTDDSSSKADKDALKKLLNEKSADILVYTKNNAINLMDDLNYELESSVVDPSGQIEYYIYVKKDASK